MSQKSSDEERSVGCLPDRLKAEIAIHVHLNTLKRVDIFQNTEAGFLCELVLRLKPVLFSPGDYVCRKDEVGHAMYIVSRGILQVVANEGKTVVATLKAGSYFGEISVLNVGTAGNKRTASVRSVGYSDLFCLNKKDLWDVLKDYPNAERRIRLKAEQRLSKLELGKSNPKQANGLTLADATNDANGSTFALSVSPLAPEHGNQCLDQSLTQVSRKSGHRDRGQDQFQLWPTCTSSRQCNLEPQRKQSRRQSPRSMDRQRDYSPQVNSNRQRLLSPHDNQHQLLFPNPHHATSDSCFCLCGSAPPSAVSPVPPNNQHSSFRTVSSNYNQAPNICRQQMRQTTRSLRATTSYRKLTSNFQDNSNNLYGANGNHNCNALAAHSDNCCVPKTQLPPVCQSLLIANNQQQQQHQKCCWQNAAATAIDGDDEDESDTTYNYNCNNNLNVAPRRSTFNTCKTYAASSVSALQLNSQDTRIEIVVAGSNDKVDSTNNDNNNNIDVCQDQSNEKDEENRATDP